MAACYRTQVTPRIHESPTLKLKEKNKRKFNFEEIEKEVGMPVIRTEIECLSYLKMLTKKELGIDLDQTDIPEGVEPVELPSMEEKGPEKINWCECWRQELKKLQGFIFSRSSTSELEVDLSPNVSGSEWSIINFPTVILPEKSLSVGKPVVLLIENYFKYFSPMNILFKENITFKLILSRFLVLNMFELHWNG